MKVRAAALANKRADKFERADVTTDSAISLTIPQIEFGADAALTTNLLSGPWPGRRIVSLDRDQRP